MSPARTIARALWMEGETVCLLDQRALPHEQTVLRLRTYEETTQAIRDMAVRGAGAIGIAGGFAMAQAARAAPPATFWPALERAAAVITAARPTAKNLSYAVERVLTAMRTTSDVAAARHHAVAEAHAIYDDDARMAKAIGQAGLSLLPSDKAVLTHCNTGWLAFADWGTALAPIYLAHQQGQSVAVYVTETRPRGQGAKLTTWELQQANIPHVLIADTAAGYYMAKGDIGMVIVGADRIAANGDTANKIGTYTLATLATAHGIPFYVAAPSSTFDAACPSGAQIPIEERSEHEVLEVSGVTTAGAVVRVRLTAEGIHAKNPAFDVTPAALITRFVTEAGLIAPTREAIAQFLERAGRR